jgi:hypothetical protein
MRCQRDDTDEIDEIDDDGDEPRHYVAPGTATAPAGNCLGADQALGLANLLGGDRPRVRRPVR